MDGYALSYISIYMEFSSIYCYDVLKNNNISEI